MPTYEYVCNKCGSQFEYFQSISSRPLETCPMEVGESGESNKQCGGSVKRLISGGAGFLFRGSGFYATDYRSESYKEKAKKESEGASGSSESKESSSSSTQSSSDGGESKGSSGGNGSGSTSGSSGSSDSS